MHFWGIFLIKTERTLLSSNILQQGRDISKYISRAGMVKRITGISFSFPFYEAPYFIQNKSSFFQGNSSEWSRKIRCWSILSLQFNLKQRKIQIPSTKMWEFPNILAFVSIPIHSIKGLVGGSGSGYKYIRIHTIWLCKYIFNLYHRENWIHIFIYVYDT